VLIPAAAAAVLLALLAPEPWPTEPATVTVSLEERPVATKAIEIGPTAAISLTGDSGDSRVTVTFPAGVTADSTVTADVRLEQAGRVVQPTLDQIELEIELADGRRELIPMVRWDAEREVLIASRRPPVDAAAVMGLLGAVVVLWVTEAIPLFVTSLLIPIVLVVADVAPAAEALAPFFHPIIALFFGGFLMAEAMKRVGLDHLAAISIVTRAGRSPITLFGAMLTVSAFLSMWMSNTASTAVLVPIALAVSAPLGIGFRKAAVLGIAYAATIGGVGSAIGTPANPLAIEFLDTFAGQRLAFVDWFAYGLPMVIVFLPVMAAYLWWRSRVQIDSASFAEARRVARTELEQAGRPTRDQLTVLAVFVGVMLLWLTQTWHEINTGIIALMGAVALAMLGRILPEDLGRISWASLLTFGGGLTLGFALTESGTSDWLATRLAGLSGLPDFLGIAAVAALSLLLTTVASNTATAAMLVPLAIPLAGVLGVDPLLMVLVVAIASSIDFALVIGTPPTMIAYSTELYTAPEIFRKGIVLDVIGIVLLVTVVTGFWQVTGLV
jgi:sodium-dependent dicarboxylate transporter 2/3/5